MTNESVGNARAGLEQINSVTLPKIYREIGRRVAKSPKPPAALKHHFDAIARLKPAADAKNPAAVEQLREVYAALGREAVEKYGEKAVPRDVAPHLDAAIAKRNSAMIMLQSETEPRTPPRASEPTEVVAAPRMLSFPQAATSVRRRRRRTGRASLVLGGLLLIVACGVAVALAWPSIFRNVARSVAVATQGLGSLATSRDQSSRGGGGKTTTNEEAIDRAVVRTLGAVSGAYPDYGLAGVELGQTYDEVTATTELPQVDRENPFKFLSAEGDQYFVFDADRRLRVYGKRYVGGPAENGEVVRRVFGQAGNQAISRVFKTRQSRTDSKMLVYSFPRVIAFVEFRATRFIVYGRVEERAETFLYVLDRRWALPMLHKSAAVKRPLIEWMKLAADGTSVGKCDDAAKYVPKGVSLVPIDENRPNRRWNLVEAGKDAQEASLGWVRTVSPENLKYVHMKPGSVGVDVDLSGIPALRGDVFLMDDIKKGTFDAIRHAPVLGVLDIEVTLQLMLETFAPEDGDYNYVPDERGGVTVGTGYYESTHVSSSNAVFDVVWNTMGGAGAFFIGRPNP